MSAAMQAHLDQINWENDARNCDADETPVLYFTDAEGNDAEKKLPTTWVVCDVCRGAGSHVNPSIDCGGLTCEDFDEDPDFAEAYMSGAYDQTCNRCRGRTTVRAVDWDALSPEDAKAYEEQLDEDARYRGIEAAERRMGA
jgi:hypothetical protein